MKLNKKGFTLIELLVVVAIIGILAAIALPKLFAAICTSKVGNVDGAIGSINGAMTMYFADNAGNYPNTAGIVSSLAILSPKYVSGVKTPWSGGPYNVQSGTQNYSICAALNGGSGCDDTTKAYRYYSSSLGTIGFTSSVTGWGC